MDCNSKKSLRRRLVLVLLAVLFTGPGIMCGQQTALIQTRSDSPTSDSSTDVTSTSTSNSQDFELKVSAPAQADVNSNSELANGNENSGDDSSGNSQPLKTGKVEADKRGGESKVEPESTDGTYNQVRVRKPSIPSSFDPATGVDPQSKILGNNSPVSFLGLLGIPTLVFSVLFFVMWGIISGKIQRIMF